MQAPDTKSIDWSGALGAAFVAALLGGGLFLLSDKLGVQGAPLEPREAPIDIDAVDAAAVLGVEIDASADEVRAALRDKLKDGGHPDQGGDDELAKKLVAAQNLLLARLKVGS